MEDDGVALVHQFTIGRDPTGSTLGCRTVFERRVVPVQPESGGYREPDEDRLLI